MTDREILIWIHERLVHVHGDSPYVDYMHALRDVIHGTSEDKVSRGPAVTMHSMDVLDEIRRDYQRQDAAPHQIPTASAK